MNILSIKDLDLDNKKVFIRVDFNVPLDSQGEISDATRIDKALPTIKFAMEQNGKIILGSHLGRPKGKVSPEYSLEPVAKYLAEKLDVEVFLSDLPIGDSSFILAKELKPKQILLLENLRFDPGETKNDEKFAKNLASLADVYINDAFGTAHRAHASTVGMVSFFKNKGLGFLLEKEVNFLGKLLEKPEKPFIAILGGAKVSDKVGVIKNLMKTASKIIIGGAMANTFLAARGFELGNSKIETSKFNLCREIDEIAKLRNVELLLPKDVVVANSLDATEVKIVKVGEKIDANLMALDIGPETRKLFEEVVKSAKTIFWNGPMGVFENPLLAEGTISLANAVAQSESLSVVGGGDSVSAINKAGVSNAISHISTGGGASLEMMEGKVLPGINSLIY
jgi:phosphoglycerate kinase